MDEITTIMDLRLKVKDFSENRSWHNFHTPRNLAESIVIEASELLAEFQWDNLFDNPFNRDATFSELADVIILCLTMANVLDVDLTDAILKKIKVNSLKYPLPDDAEDSNLTWSLS